MTSGLYGWTMVVTGAGPDISAARSEAYARAARIFVPAVRYRLDIGDRLIAADYDAVAGPATTTTELAAFLDAFIASQVLGEDLSSRNVV